MAHRLLHSLVFSSVVLLEGIGCSMSHGPPPEPDADPGGDGGPPPEEDAGSPRDGGWLDDAGRLRDAGAIRDAWLAPAEDGGGPDAGASSDGGATDAGDPRMCEDGWPPTKGFWCVLEDEQVRCCRGADVLEDGGLIGGDCCVAPAEEGS